MNYEEFINSKSQLGGMSGFKPSFMPDCLFDFQKAITEWAVMKGKAAIFADCGLGKTLMQLVWAENVVRETNGRVLILAPLAVAKQTVHEAEKFGIHVHYCRHDVDICQGINITNYEMLHHFEECDFAGIVLDESGIIKDVAGKLRNLIIDRVQNIPFRLACSATPAPNDYTELGNHAELLGICSYREMLTTYFVNDIKCPEGWRLKRHASDKFFEWIASWGVFLTKPSDLGYSDEGFNLPGLITHQHSVESAASEGALFAFEVKGLQERQAARRASMQVRIAKCVEVVNNSAKPFLVWCDLNAESEAIVKAIPGAVQITGSDKPEAKEKAMLDFAAGKIEVLVSKPSICGRGMNWQICANVAFLGLSDSFEAIFQATRRVYRHGQKKEVNRHIIISEAEGPVLQNVQRKETLFLDMINSMVEHTKNITRDNIKQLAKVTTSYEANMKITIPSWIQENANDCD